MNIDARQLATVITRNQELPVEGSGCIPVQTDFSQDTSFSIDLLMLEQETRFTDLQTLYIDASGLSGRLQVLVVGGTNQSIIANPGTQGFYTILAPNPTKIQINYLGADIPAGQFVILINVPIPGAVWTSGTSTGPTKIITGSGNLNFPNIVDGDVAELTFALVGALAGDSVIPAWPSTLETGLVGIMFVNAADTIKVRLLNMSGAAVDPAAQVFGATIVR